MTLNLNNLSIKTKLYGGFGMLIAICLGLAVFGMMQFGSIQTTNAAMQIQAVNSFRNKDLLENFEKMRRSVLRYAYDHDEASLKQNGELSAKALAALENSEKKATSEERRKIYKGLQDDVIVLRKSTGTLAEIAVHAEEEKAKLFKAGDELTAAAAKLADALKGGQETLETLALQIDADLQKVRVANWRSLATLDVSGLATLKAATNKASATIAALEKAELSQNARAAIAPLKAALAAYAATGADAIENVAKVREIYLKEVAPKIVKMQETLDGAVKGSIELFENSSSHVVETIAEATLLQQIIAGIGLLFGLIIAWMIGRAIANPLRALVKPLEEIAGGNFAIEVPGMGRKDEVGLIASAVGAMAEKVSATIGQIKASGREVTNASAEISTSTTDLSQRTEEQAASLEETSASMEEMTATVKKNAENAQQASSLAASTQDVANRGGEVVAKTVEAMAKIEDSSRKISDIIGVIDEIARQTNLLALNAAVEAARAGEAGRGFAVVASEVRSLAQRSSQAAKDIKDLITNSNGQVKDGVELVNKAGASLSEIVDSIKKVTAVVSEIANASMEQSTGIEQINKALTQMDEVTQQNSALVEENAATAKTLEHQAKVMDEQVAFFQIGNGDDNRVPSYAPEPMAKPAPRKAAAPPPRGPAAPKSQPAAEPKRAAVAASGGGARRMQAALATAVNAEPDWKEF